MTSRFSTKQPTSKPTLKRTAFKHSRIERYTIMALPTSKQTSNSEFTPFEAGTYQVTLKRIDLDINKEYETEKFNNGDGLRYQGCTMVWDVDGEEYRERFIKISLDNRAKFFNRLSALLGRDIQDDSDKLDWGVSSSANTNAEYDDYFRANNADFYEAADSTKFGTSKPEDAKLGEDGKPIVKVKKGEYLWIKHINDGIIGTLDHLKVNGEDLYGKSCLLVLKVNKKGYNAADAGAASPLPKANSRRAQPLPAGMPS